MSISLERFVTLVQSLAGFIAGDFVELQRKKLVLDSLSPPLIQFFGVDRPCQLIAIDDHRLINRKVMRRVDQHMRDRQPLVKALQISLECLVSEIDIPNFQQIIQLIPIPGKTINVRLQVVQLLRIEIFDELGKNHCRNTIVEWLLVDVEP